MIGIAQFTVLAVQIKHDQIGGGQLGGTLQNRRYSPGFTRTRAAQQRSMTLEKFITIQVGSSIPIQGILSNFKSLLRITFLNEKTHERLQEVPLENKTFLADVRQIKK